MFEYFNHKICVESGALVENGILTKPNYDKLKRVAFVTIRRACKDTPGLILFESIPERFRRMIIEKFGEPIAILKKTNFESYLEIDETALKFYREYRLDNEKSLPEGTITEYTTNASILITVRKLLNNRISLRKALGGTTKGIWGRLTDEIDELDRTKWPHTLPGNERRLRDKYNLFLKDGYDCLIHANFCNQNSEKLNEKSKLWLLAMWANQVDKITGIKHCTKPQLTG